ncbi:MAG: FKBP-type peptidyl-prolyl cis-trans isomerase, partial [Kiritimatiellae bacterium]|nr:FKBP-type peptidyl-prolyl cis-trans isomerase [Kiritimatiellia bacterium]
GDFVQIDYSGTVDKKPILEIAPEAKVVASGKGFWTQVEEGRFLPEILDAVKGMKVGETKDEVKVKFAKEGAPEGLGGKKAVYAVTLKGFRRRILPTDAEFAEKAKAESVEKLAATIRETLEKQAVEAESRRREDEAVELLLKKVDFDVPQLQVRQARNAYLEDLAKRAQYSGLDASYFEQNQEKILKDAEEAATRQVRLWYVIDAIAKAENIEAKDEEKGRKVVEFVLANAKK